MFRKTLVTFSFALVAAAMLSGIANAQWNPGKQIRDAASRAEKSIRREAGRGAEAVRRAHRMSYKVRIENPTGGHIKYSFAGERQVPLIRGRVVTWSGVGKANIAFDNGRNQTVRYKLGTSGAYYFAWKNGRLDLYRR